MAFGEVCFRQHAWMILRRKVFPTQDDGIYYDVLMNLRQAY